MSVGTPDDYHWSSYEVAAAHMQNALSAASCADSQPANTETYCLLYSRCRFRKEVWRECLTGIRERRRRMAKADFEPLAIVGRGAFGEVRLVRKKVCFLTLLYCVFHMLSLRMSLHEAGLSSCADAWTVTVAYTVTALCNAMLNFCTYNRCCT
jgi:hypothetical protein